MSDFIEIFVGLGSNIEREVNIKGGILALEKKFGDLKKSSIYESKAYGFDGENFFNLVVEFDSDISLPDLVSELREIEKKFGRQREQQRFKPRTLDIDLLLYGDLVQHDEQIDLPREDIDIYAFVLCPLAEIAGNSLHPVKGITYSEMWEQFNKESQEIWKVTF